MKAIDGLTQMDLEERKARYPNTPPHAFAVRRFNDRTTNGLTAAVLRWLELRGHYAVRINATGRRLPDQVITDVIGRRRVIRGAFIPGSTRTGTADIHAVIQGNHVSIEIKCAATRDRISEAQRETQRDIEHAGGLYFVATDFESFADWYTRTFKQQQQ